MMAKHGRAEIRRRQGPSESPTCRESRLGRVKVSFQKLKLCYQTLDDLLTQ